jgi:hypothetical protein
VTVRSNISKTRWGLELFFEVVLWPFIRLIFYWPGWLLLKVLTFGRYPPKRPIAHDRDAVALFAIVTLAAFGAILSVASR